MRVAVKKISVDDPDHPMNRSLGVLELSPGESCDRCALLNQATGPNARSIRHTRKECDFKIQITRRYNEGLAPLSRDVPRRILWEARDRLKKAGCSPEIVASLRTIVAPARIIDNSLDGELTLGSARWLIAWAATVLNYLLSERRNQTKWNACAPKLDKLVEIAVRALLLCMASEEHRAAILAAITLARTPYDVIKLIEAVEENR